MYTKLQNYSLCYRQTKLYICPSVKTATYLCNGPNTSFCIKDDETHQAISDLNQKF